jgi:heme-degrading monooxygenase HmoA
MSAERDREAVHADREAGRADRAETDPGRTLRPGRRVECWRSAHPSEEKAVIIRVFRPTIHPGKEREFESFLRDTAIPLVSQQAGLVAQHVGRPRDPSSTEYLYVTVWEDVESIRAFAGERWQEAVITPDEEHLLKDTWIGHYEILPIPG